MTTKHWSSIWKQCFHRQWKISNPDQNIPKVLGVVCHHPLDQLVSHSLQGFFSDASHIRLDAVQESYSLALRGGRGSGVWVAEVIEIKPLEQAAWEDRKGWKGGFGWMSGKWDVTIYFSFIVSFGCHPKKLA